MAPATFSSSSSSAIGTMVVSKSTLEKDILLALIVETIPSGQIMVDVKTGKKPVATELKILNNSMSLFQRSAIIRGLCGAALCNALDGSPFYLLGGHATPGSPQESVALASICSWMSVAASGEPRDGTFWKSLNRHLESRAFLTPSASATVADLDLALGLFGEKAAFDYPHISRWLEQCHHVCTRMAGDSVKVPALAVAPAPRVAAPCFFYEWEENAIPKPLQVKAGSDNKQQQQGGGKKQQQQQQQGGKKKENCAAKAPASVAADFDISALNIRVGKILKVWPHREADKLFCEEIDIGEESGPRSIASGLRPFYKTEELEGKMVLVLANLKKRNLVGFPSHGMVLCSSNADHTQVQIVSPPEGSKAGERVEFEGFEGKDPEPENKVAKKKIFEKLAPDLKTTGDRGEVVWKDAKAKTSAGVITGMPGGQVA